MTVLSPADAASQDTRDCQSGTWSAGQKKNKGISSTKLQQEHESKNKTKQNKTENDKKKGTKTKYTCQENIEEEQ